MNSVCYNLLFRQNYNKVTWKAFKNSETFRAGCRTVLLLIKTNDLIPFTMSYCIFRVWFHNSVARKRKHNWSSLLSLILDCSWLHRKEKSLRFCHHNRITAWQQFTDSRKNSIYFHTVLKLTGTNWCLWGRWSIENQLLCCEWYSALMLHKLCIVGS